MSKAPKAKAEKKPKGGAVDLKKLRPAPARARTMTCWWSVPASVSPSQPYRLIGGPVLLAVLVAAAVIIGATAAWVRLGWSGGLGWSVIGPGAELMRALTLGNIGSDSGAGWMEYVQAMGHPTAVVMLATGTWAAGLMAAVEVFRWTCRTRTALQIIDGHQVVQGDDAWESLRRSDDVLTARQVLERDTNGHRFALPLASGIGWKPVEGREPADADGLWWSKDRWSRGVIVRGSVGSGKSQFIMPVVAAMCRNRRAKAMIYDAKGEYFAALGNVAGGSLLAPHDSRTDFWDIAEDVVDLDDARVFASTVSMSAGVSGGGNGEYFRTAAADLLRGVLAGLITEHGKSWGWDTFHDAASGERGQLHKKLMAWGQTTAADRIKEPGPTSDSVLSTLRNCLTAVHVLAQAWPYNPDRKARHRFSVREWVADSYDVRNRPRVLFLKADGHMEVAGQWIAWLVNAAQSRINRPELPDGTTSRCLGFVFDELTSVGRLDVAGLFERGRAKGVVPVVGVQDMAQISEVYGANAAKALAAMVGTQITMQTMAGETRDQIAAQFGQQRVAWTPHGEGLLHEEVRPVIASDFLTRELGVFKGGRSGFFCRALVYTGKDDDIRLVDFPGRAWPQVRTPYREAAWMKRATKAAQDAYAAQDDDTGESAPPPEPKRSQRWSQDPEARDKAEQVPEARDLSELLHPELKNLNAIRVPDDIREWRAHKAAVARKTNDEPKPAPKPAQGATAQKRERSEADAAVRLPATTPAKEPQDIKAARAAAPTWEEA
ncbi:MAG: type IV secretion system DNA-binding domain-containing protein [Xanthomonadaceae bacterium]|nr:type IV secretion system DNA-binding domain-containing protein [Xanthomonadaceae bacterium]